MSKIYIGEVEFDLIEPYDIVILYCPKYKKEYLSHLGCLHCIL